MLHNDKAVDVDPVHQLELIDTLQRLGLAYLFDTEIRKNYTLYGPKCYK